jgi:hypothetical protein
MGVDRARCSAPGHFLRPLQEKAMKKEYEEIVTAIDETPTRVTPLVKGIGTTRPLAAPAPAGRKMSPASIRRTIVRLRAGKIRPLDPTVDPLAYADALEKGLHQMKLIAETLREVEALALTISSGLEKIETEATAEALEVFHAAKQLAEEPGNDDVSEHVRKMHRALRDDRGRPRKRRR